MIAISINSFGALVGDSDGGVFVTKEEFENLKRDFDAQLVRYDESLTTKIDGAIANYLNGIKITDRSAQRLLASGDWYCVETGYTAGSSDYTWRYKYGSPRISNFGVFNYAGYNTDGSMKNWVNQWQNMAAPAYDEAKHAQHKLLISNVSETRRVAEWAGISYGASDLITCISLQINEYIVYYDGDAFYWSPWRANMTPGGNYVERNQNFYNFRLINCIMGRSEASVETEFKFFAQNLTQSWGSIKNKNIILLNGKNYYNFSRYPESRNWHFYNSAATPNTNFEKLWTDLTAARQNTPSEFNNCFSAGAMGQRQYKPDRTWGINENKPLRPSSIIAYRSSDTAGVNYGDQRADISKRMLWPCVGFEDNYITNWNQLYLTQFDTVAKDSSIESYRGRFLLDDNGTYHVGIVNGLPLFKVSKKETVMNFDIDLRYPVIDISNGNETYQYKDSYVWISESPFTGWPNDNTDCLTITSLDSNSVAGTGSSYDKAIKIPASSNGVAKIQVTATKKDNYLWMKWTTNGTSGGGLLKVPETCVVEVPK